MKATSERNRTIMSVIAIVVGLLMITVIPFLVQTSLERVLKGLSDHVAAGNPAFKSGIPLFDLFYPIWRALIFVAGIALIVISQEIKKGSEWTYPLSMLLFAAPAMGGMFMFLPYVSWVDGFPVPMLITLIGLVGYFSFIFLREASLQQKLVRLAALTFIGMMATHAFTIGIGAQRTMMTRPGYPFYPDFSWWLFNWVGEVNWVAFPLLVASIPFLAVSRRKGWWLAVIAAIAILAIDAPTQFIRTKTLDYLYGSLLALGVLVFTVVPYFKNILLDGETRPREEIGLSEETSAA
ncbi:MAG: hypothetical protein B6D39_12075 [Anaerolineae bacterium UTCFX2]|jgi:hypothetical protein|nr:hypothetical protein [Anaerolineae bacterium]MCZ7554274.1 hypothetical protein [Anaerolineales bacterium]OQY87943.1 MAG: hypothetical protein B6D39_12075 [Anaerolineae bacterium UTCFX2]